MMQSESFLRAFIEYQLQIIYLPVNFAYWFVAIMCVFGLCWVNRLAFYMRRTRVGQFLRASSLLLSSALMIKALNRFNLGGDAATYYDVFREGCLLIFIAAVIMLMRGNPYIIRKMNEASMKGISDVH